MATEEILAVKGITKRFGGVVALNKVDISVKKHSRHVIIGPNGSGKSTLINVLSGVYTPDDGEVLFDGEKISGFRPFRIVSRGVARTFQNIRPIKGMNVWENIALGMHCRTNYGFFEAMLHVARQPEESKQIAARVAELAAFFGIANILDKNMQSLPYGKQRIVEIARALASSPSLLLLDEPAAGMNTAEAQLLAESIRKISSLGITIVLIEHNMEFVKEIADTITVLDSGEKIAEGDFSTVQTNSRVVEAYLGKRGATNLRGTANA